MLFGYAIRSVSFIFPTPSAQKKRKKEEKETFFKVCPALAEKSIDSEEKLPHLLNNKFAKKLALRRRRGHGDGYGGRGPDRQLPALWRGRCRHRGAGQQRDGAILARARPGRNRRAIAAEPLVVIAGMALANSQGVLIRLPGLLRGLQAMPGHCFHEWPGPWSQRGRGGVGVAQGGGGRCGA